MPTLCCTRALLARHRFPVASSLTQPQIASSALKSGLYPGRACPRENAGSPASDPAVSGRPEIFPPRFTAPELAEGALGHCPRSRSLAQNDSHATVSGSRPKFRRCCSPPVPSIPLRPSPSTPPSSPGLLTPVGAGRLHQRRFTLQHLLVT